MAVQTYWDEIDVTTSGVYASTELNMAHTQSQLYGQGTSSVLIGSVPPSVPFNITSANCDLNVWMKSSGSSTSRIITLPSGTNLDCRSVARYLTEKLHMSIPAGNPECWTTSSVDWVNDHFEIKNGCAGANSQIKVQSTSNSAATTLGFTEDVVYDGTDQGRNYYGYYSSQGRLTNVYSGSCAVDGTCTLGGYDEYTITAVESALGGGGATLIAHPSGTFSGDVTIGGIYNYHKDAYLYMHVTASGGSAYANGISTTCPQLSWYMITPTASGGIDPYLTSMSGTIPLLFPDRPVFVGDRGLWVKFTNNPFDTQEAWTIECSGIQKGANYTAGQSERKIIWSSLTGDIEWEPQDTATPGSFIDIGKYGLTMSFDEAYPIESGDTFRIKVPGPSVYSHDVTSVNLGNITVSTTSRVFCTRFGILSGAVSLDNVKFGLLSDGGMSQRNGVDTYFSYGTVGAGQEAVDGDLHWQFRNGVDKTDLTGTPVYLYATDPDLQEVASADDSKTIGVSSYEGLQSDFIWNAIRLGADEAGAKTIAYRIYFDYS